MKSFFLPAAFVSCLLIATSTLAEFRHPGIAHTRASIDFVKTKIAAEQEPWASAWKVVQASRYVDLDWKPRPRAHVERGPYNNPNIGSSEFSADAMAAYQHALSWSLSRKEVHAHKAAEILNAWSETLQSISNHDARLLVGMEGYKFCNAAELLKHTWDGWAPTDQAQFGEMLKDVFYPVIKDFYPSANGNWDASMLQTMLAMGVYLDDREMFDRGVDYYLNGKGNGAVRNYFKPSGQCQESGRDQAHTQMGLDFLACTCEIAWNQGVDLYGAYENRLLTGFEYTAKYNLGFDVPYEAYRSFEGRYHYKTLSDKSRGSLRPMYEKVLNHFEIRKGLEAPFTRQAAMKLRKGSDHSGDRDDGKRSRRRRPSAIGTLMFSKPDGFQQVTEKQTATLTPQPLTAANWRGEAIERLKGIYDRQEFRVQDVDAVWSDDSSMYWIREKDPQTGKSVSVAYDVISGERRTAKRKSQPDQRESPNGTSKLENAWQRPVSQSRRVGHKVDVDRRRPRCCLS